MTDKTMTAVEALAVLAAHVDMREATGKPNLADEIRQARNTLSATLQARDSEVKSLYAAIETYRQEYRRARFDAEQAEAECARLRADARRYRALKPRLVGADFAWNSPPISVLIFEYDGPVSANLDAMLDALTPHVEPVGINAGVDAEGGGA